MKEKLKRLFEENNGCLSAAQMRGQAFRYHLNKMITSGKVYKLRHGLYVHTDYQQCDERVMVANMVPNGVFFLFSAWQLHELSTTVSHQYHLAVPRTTKISPISQPPVVLYYLSQKVYQLGIIEWPIDGITVKCYDKERSVCDAVKFRNKSGEEMMQEVIKNYMKQKDKNLNKLLEYAKVLRVEKNLMPYLKALL